MFLAHLDYRRLHGLHRLLVVPTNESIAPVVPFNAPVHEPAVVVATDQLFHVGAKFGSARSGVVAGFGCDIYWPLGLWLLHGWLLAWCVA